MATKKRPQPKGGPRLSIIPARAVTDPEISAQALRVLALLGRHTDDLGWCRRSQVTMAEELSCDRRTIQRGIDQLEAAGYVEKRAEGRGNLEPEPGKQPFASYSYRVVLDPVDDGGGVRTGAQGGAHPGAQGVRTQARTGCADARAPLTERPLGNDPLITDAPVSPGPVDRPGDPALWALLANAGAVTLARLATWRAAPAVEGDRVVVDFSQAFAEQYVRSERAKVQAAFGCETVFRYAGREGQP